jgi:hypothetical protein
MALQSVTQIKALSNTENLDRDQTIIRQETEPVLGNEPDLGTTEGENLKTNQLDLERVTPQGLKEFARLLEKQGEGSDGLEGKLQQNLPASLSALFKDSGINDPRLQSSVLGSLASIIENEENSISFDNLSEKALLSGQIASQNISNTQAFVVVASIVASTVEASIEQQRIEAQRIREVQSRVGALSAGVIEELKANYNLESMNPDELAAAAARIAHGLNKDKLDHA